MKPQDRADEIESLEQAIAALEAQRSTLGDAAVDASVTMLREKIRALARHGGPPLQDAPAPPSRRERKTVTIVMADVQGSTDLAARMETSAKPGTVLVAESTYRLTADQFRWQPLGPIAVKGIQQPVLAYRPLGHLPQAERRHGLPGLISPLIGRERELLALRRELQEEHLTLEPMAGLAALSWQDERLDEALSWVDKTLELMAQVPQLEDTRRPFGICLTCYDVLVATDDPRAAAVLAHAYAVLRTRAKGIKDAQARQRYLEQTPYRCRLADLARTELRTA